MLGASSSSGGSSKLSKVFNADSSSDEEEIPAEARYYNLFLYLGMQLQHTENHNGQYSSSWRDFVLQNENAQRRSGDRNIEWAKQLRQDPPRIHRHFKTFREKVATGHGRRVERQRRPQQDRQIVKFLHEIHYNNNILVSRHGVLLTNYLGICR